MTVIRWRTAVAILVGLMLVITALAALGWEIPQLVVAVALVSVPLLAVRYVIAPEDRLWIGWVVVAGIGLRLLIGLAVFLFERDIVFAIFDDAIRYEQIGAAMASSWRDGQSFDLFGAYGLTVAGYYYVVAALYYLSGEAPLLIIVFNAALAGLTAVLVDRLGHEFGLQRVERRAAVAIAMFIPSVTFWAAVPLKDTFVTLALLSGLFAAVRLRWPDLGVLALLGVSILVMASLRLYVIFFIAMAAVVILLFDGVWRRRPLWMAATVALVFLLELYSLQGPVGALITLAATDPTELERQRDIYDQGGSAVGAVNGASPSAPFTIRPVTTAPGRPSPENPRPRPSGSASPRPTGSASPTPTGSASPAAVRSSAAGSPAPEGRVQRYLQFAAQMPLFVADFFIQPIPFVTSGRLAPLAIPEMLLWYLAIPLAFAGLALMWRRDRVVAAIIVLLTIGMAVVYGTIVGNAGSLLRYRGPTLVVLAMPIAVGAHWLWLRYAASHMRAVRVRQ